MARPRKPKPMNWHVYVGRRRLNVEALFEAAKIRSYDALLVWCKQENIDPPTCEEMKGKFGTKRKAEATPVTPEASVEEEAPKPPKASKADQKSSKAVQKASKSTNLGAATKPFDPQNKIS